MNITLVAAVSGAVLNTVLDVIFVIVLGWGIAGSGFATLIAQWFMGLFLALPALIWAHGDGVSLRPHFVGIAAAGQDGFPLFVRTLALRIAIVATVVVAASMGTSVLAGYQIVNAVWNFAVNILDSVAIAGQALVGAKLGAKEFDRCAKSYTHNGAIGHGYGCLCGRSLYWSRIFCGFNFSLPTKRFNRW